MAGGAKTLLFFILSIYCSNFCLCGIFTWLFKTPEQDSRSNSDSQGNEAEYLRLKGHVISGEAPVDVKVPFEMKSTDEKFLKEVTQLVSIELSNLDLCHHRVILSLQKSCSDLSEEELSKAAVNLLNCQSSVEQRAIFPCTDEMALHECTRNMDESTWNAYHIVSNRVRAVCYNFRQQQFTMKTELSVNKLVQSTSEQIDAMKLLEKSHSVLQEATSDTLSSLSSGHVSLKKQQQELSFAHLNMRNYVSTNIRELTREKRLIALGQKELSAIIHTIKRKLEEAQQQLETQGHGQRTSHQKIIQDLSEIQENAGRVWHQIERSTKIILERHEETVTHYARLMDDLQKMNGTVHHLMNILLKMKVKVEEKFSWISSLLGDTDATVQKIYSFILHICYCMIGMVAAIFLQIPYVTRLALIILVPLNAVAEMNNEVSLPFSTMTAVLAICMFFNLSTIGVTRVYRWHRLKGRKAICDTASSLQPQTNKIAVRKKDSGIEDNPSMFVSTQTLNQSLGRHKIEEEAEEQPFRKSWMKEEVEDEEEEEEEPFGKSWTKGNDSNSSRNCVLPTPLSSILEDEELDSSFPRSSYSCISHRKPSSHQISTSINDGNRRRFLTNLNSSSPPSFSPLSVPLKEPFLSPLGALSSSFNGRKSRSSTPLREERFSLSQSLTPKRICSAICKSGLPCKNTASAPDGLCHRHLSGPSRESTPPLRGVSDTVNTTNPSLGNGLVDSSIHSPLQCNRDLLPLHEEAFGNKNL